MVSIMPYSALHIYPVKKSRPTENRYRFEDAKHSVDEKLVKLMKEENFDEVLRIIKNHPGEELMVKMGKHLLHAAAKYKSVETIHQLIKSGYKVSAKDSSGMSPIMIAIMYKNLEVAKALHQAQMDLAQERLAVPITRQPLTRQNCERRKLELSLVKSLVSRMRKKRFSSELIGLALAKIMVHCLACDVVSFGDADMTKAFLRSVGSSGSSAGNLSTVFDMIAAKRDLRHIRVLLENAPCDECRLYDWLCKHVINARSVDCHKSRSGRKFLKGILSLETFSKRTLKHLESSLPYLRYDSVRVILRYDLHSVAKAEYGRDILACLFGNGRSDVTSLLRDEQIDVSGRGYHGRTPLHFAAANHCLDNVQMLLERGADPNALDEKQRTPLAGAIVNDHCRSSKMYDCLKALLLAGASPLLVASDLVDDLISARRHSKLGNYFIDAHMLAVAQIVIYETLGRDVDGSIVRLFRIMYGQELDMFVEECRRQLTEMQKHKIHHETHDLSMFSILAESPQKLARQLAKRHLQSVFHFVDNNRIVTIPYYSELLKRRAENIAQLQCYRPAAVQVVCQFTGISDPHHLVIHKIVSYFSANDLMKFAMTTRPNFSLRAKHFIQRTKRRISEF